MRQAAAYCSMIHSTTKQQKNNMMVEKKNKYDFFLLMWWMMIEIMEEERDHQKKRRRRWLPSCFWVDDATRALSILSWRRRIPPGWAQGYWGWRWTPHRHSGTARSTRRRKSSSKPCDSGGVSSWLDPCYSSCLMFIVLWLLNCCHH